MAHVERRTRNGKLTWRARYRHPDGLERSRSFSTQREATRWLDKVRGDIVRGEYVDPTDGRRLFGEYAKAWQAAQVHRPSTVTQVDGHMRNHVLPYFGHRPLASIRPSEVQTFVRHLAATLAPATVTVCYRYLAAIFKAAASDQLIVRSPCVGVKLPKIEREKVQPLPVETVHALSDAVPARYRALVILAAGTGLRQGEALGLSVDRVDFLRRQLRVDRQLVLVRGAPEFGPPKTESSRRIVPLPSVVADALAAHLAAFPAGPDGLIFTSASGAPLRRTRFSEVWRPAVTKANAPAGTGFHALRHFYASALIAQGSSVKVVAEMLGHASAAETLSTYAHLWPDDEDRTRTAIDAVLGPAQTPMELTSGEVL